LQVIGLIRLSGIIDAAQQRKEPLMLRKSRLIQEAGQEKAADLTELFRYFGVSKKSYRVAKKVTG
jgi:ribosome-interacting GTPase 1